MILSAVRDPYPTRDKNEGALVRRSEPVVHSQWHDNAPLTQAQHQQFEQLGFVVLTDVFSSFELDALRADAERTAHQWNTRTDCERVVLEPDTEQMRTLFGVHQHEGLLGETASNPRVLDVVEYLLNDSVYIHQSRLNFKNPVYGSGFEWHSDFETWHAEDGMPGMRALSATVLLTDEVSADGSLKFIPGSHRTFVACPGETPDTDHQRALRRQMAGKPPSLFLDLLEEHGGVQELVAPAGSVVLMDCNLMHGAGKNTSDFLRANLFYVYNAVSNALGKPFAANAARPEFIATRDISPLTALSEA